MRTAFAAALVLALPLPALAQGFAVGVPQPPSEAIDFVRREGGIHFCLNAASALIEFDRAAGQAMADTILSPAEFHEIVDLEPPRPFDFVITVETIDLYVEVTNHCDALLGYYVTNDAIPEWLTVTQPYSRTNFVLVTRDPAIDALGDLPAGAAVGSRLGTPADSQFRTYVGTQAAGTIRRLAYPVDASLLRDLDAGLLGAALVWEPALYLATGGDPAAAGYHIAAMPFAVPTLDFAVALPSDQLYLRTELDTTIAALRADGVIADLLAGMGLPPGE